MRGITWLVVLVAACEGGSGGGFGSGPITQAQAEQACGVDCEHEMTCGDEQDLQACIDRCAAEVVGWARADAVQTIFDCAAALPCDANPDACLLEVEPLAIHREWETRCFDAVGTCPGINAAALCEVDPDPVDEEIGIIRFISAPIMEELIACMDGVDCAARIACVQMVLEANNVDF